MADEIPNPTPAPRTFRVQCVGQLPRTIIAANEADAWEHYRMTVAPFADFAGAAESKTIVEITEG